MRKKDLLKYLRNYQAWRRGLDEEIPQPKPTELGKMIDAAIAVIEKAESDEDLFFGLDMPSNPPAIGACSYDKGITRYRDMNFRKENMKTAYDYFELAKEQLKEKEEFCTFSQIHEKMIELAQRDAYNQAIDDATSQECDFVMEDEKKVVYNSIEWIQNLKKK